uniref:Glyoxalase domain-containing protein n=1 Tax=Macrostomum lignano TaxID=282301 RepID=A0A1I8FFV4_9PLAT
HSNPNPNPPPGNQLSPVINIMALSKSRARRSVQSRHRPETSGFIMQQTMLRVKDPRASLDFYSSVLGMRGCSARGQHSKGDTERIAYLFRLPGTVELTHNYGTESDPDQRPGCRRGLQAFRPTRREVRKKPDDGKMKGLAFILDPDGYWIEILNAAGLVEIAKVD